MLSAVQAPEAAAVIEARAAEFSAPLLLADRDFSLVGRDLAVGGQMLDIQGTAAEYTDVFLPLHGRHQAQNATLAVATVEQFLGGRALDPQLVRDGLGAATSPGRLEVLRTVPTVVGDAAHNPQGTEAPPQRCRRPSGSTGWSGWSRCCRTRTSRRCWRPWCRCSTTWC